MKPLLNLPILLTLLLPAPAAIAADWVSVTTNAVGDRFFIDKTTIQRTDNTVRYWEYREFPQPNNAFLEETVDQPVHGIVLNWSADCNAKVQRLRQVTAYDKARKVIRRFSYGETGGLAQPRPGSSSGAVLSYVCDLK